MSELIGPGNLKWNTKATTILGGYGTGPNELNLPLGIFIEPKTQILYIADGHNNRIQKRYPNGQVETAAGQANGTGGSSPSTLANPVHAVADENENVYVADWENQRIQFWEKGAKSGKIVAGDGTRGSAWNEFSYPSRVVLDSNGSIIVVDTQNARITTWTLPYNPKTSNGTLVAVGCSFRFRTDVTIVRYIFVLGRQW